MSSRDCFGSDVLGSRLVGCASSTELQARAVPGARGAPYEARSRRVQMAVVTVRTDSSSNMGGAPRSPLGPAVPAGLLESDISEVSDGRASGTGSASGGFGTGHRLGHRLAFSQEITGIGLQVTIMISVSRR